MQRSAQEAAGRLDEIKVRILGVATQLALFVVLPAHLVTVFLLWRNDSLRPVDALHAGLFVGGAVTMGLLRNARPQLRAAFILAFVLCLGTVGMLLYGPQIVDGGILSISVIFAVVYFRWRGLAVVMALTALTLVGVAGAIANGWVAAPPSSLLDLRIADNAIRTLVGLVVVAFILGWFVLELMGALDGAIEGLSSAIEGQRAERRARQRTQRVLEHSQRLETIGRLAGGVAHDFNNALVVILGTAQLLARSKITNERQRRLATAVEEAAWQASDVSKQLLTFSRRDVTRPENVDVDESLKNIALVLARLLPEDVRIECVPASTARIWMDRSELDQVFINLAIHAHDTMRLGGSIEIRSQRERPSKESGSVTEPGVIIEVIDDGAGMSPEAVEQAFEPLLALGAEARDEGGQSLGLPLVREIVAAAGGRVDCFSTPGEGTRFRLWFPEQLARESSGPHPLPGLGATRGRILVVEGSEEVRALLRRILSVEGYDVIDEATVASASATFDAGPFDLVCSDSAVHGFSTRSLLESVEARAPAPPILLCSGPITDPWMNVLLADGRGAHLPKPFAPNDFVAEVARLLDAAKRGENA